MFLAVFFALGAWNDVGFYIIIYHRRCYGTFFVGRKKRADLALEIIDDLIHIEADVR